MYRAALGRFDRFFGSRLFRFGRFDRFFVCPGLLCGVCCLEGVAPVGSVLGSVWSAFSVWAGVGHIAVVR